METAGKLSASAASPIGQTDFHKPDWATLGEEVACPLCAYNLRGLIDPHCPECGYSFQWTELLNPSRRSHHYLFEHQSIGQTKLFWKTAFHTLRPIRFWNSVRPGHECVPGRLGVYWFIVAAAFLLSMTSIVGLIVVDYNVSRWGTSVFPGGIAFGPNPWAPPPPPALVPYYSFVWPDADLTPIILMTSIILAWPWLSFCALHLLGISMRRAQIQSVHIVRCVVYAWDIVLWIALFTLAAALLESALMILTRSSSPMPFSGSTLLLAGWLISNPVFIYRMLVAYQVYMRFRHAISVVLLTQLVVFFFVATVLTFVVQVPRW